MSNKVKKVLELNDTVRENLKKLYIILAGLQIVKLILWFVDTFVRKIYVEQMDYTNEQTISFFESWKSSMGVNVLAIILSLISISLCVVPIYKNCLEKRLFSSFIKPMIIVSVLNTLLMIIMHLDTAITMKERFSRDYGDGLIEMYYGPNLFGFIEIVALIASLIIVFIISSKTKAIANWKKQNNM